MVFIGDVHGEWRKLAKLIGYKGIRDATLVSLGDFGLGFARAGQDRSEIGGTRYICLDELRMMKL